VRNPNILQERKLKINKKDVLKNILIALVRYKYLYLLILPGIVFYIVFSYAPLYGIMLAFKKYKYNMGILGSPWAGFYNFELLVKDKQFWGVVRNTIVISFGKILTGFPAPIILALLLNELKNQKFKRFTQSVLYLPYFLSWVIMAGLIYNMFSSTNGILAKIYIEYFGTKPPMILGNASHFRALIYSSNIWKGAGWGTIIYLAALSGIDPSLYESATIDGANRFKQMIYITIPSLSYAIVILLLLNIGQVMNAGFDQIFNLYDPSVYRVGDIIDTYVYRIGIQSARYEYSTAVGLFKSVVNCGLLVSANWIAKKMGYEGIY
jgi:putative aldouronate transport system permease protein